jgi:hypothetical protein
VPSPPRGIRVNARQSPAHQLVPQGIDKGLEGAWLPHVAKDIPLPNRPLISQRNSSSISVYPIHKRTTNKVVTKYAEEQGIDPDDVFTEVTDNFLIQVGKAGTLRTVPDTELVSKVLGKKLFFEKCTIGLGVLDSYLTTEQKQLVLTVERARAASR